jgi:hypothetical protein
MLSSLLLPAALAMAGARLAPVSCDITNAERVTFDALLAANAPNERCVAVHGVWSGNALYRDRSAARRSGAGVPRIGIHTLDVIRARSYRPDFYTAVGNVFACRDLSVGPGALSGFCRDNPSGIYVAAGEMRRDRWPTPMWDR